MADRRVRRRGAGTVPVLGAGEDVFLICELRGVDVTFAGSIYAAFRGEHGGSISLVTCDWNEVRDSLV